MLTIGKLNNQQNKFSLGKETPCRGYHNYSIPFLHRRAGAAASEGGVVDAAGCEGDGGFRQVPEHGRCPVRSARRRSDPPRAG